MAASPRTAATDQEFTEAPAFNEMPAAPAPDAAERLAQARKDLKAMNDPGVEAEQARADETVPGGVYIVGGKLVDAWGQEVK
jgi:hypothetical protein